MPKRKRVSKKLLSQYPGAVAVRIKAIADDFEAKSVAEHTVSPNFQFHVGEGDRFYGMTADGMEASFEVVAQHNVGAADVSHKIGSKFSMPDSTFLIRVHYYTKYFVDVYRIEEKTDPEALTWEGSQSAVPFSYGKSQRSAGDVLRF
jgi:hypothetical protein